jgi:DUF4097 and DUF4098 domain-containing protein YvlB
MSEFPCDKPISVSITLASGECDVTAEDRDNATVDVQPYKNDAKSIEAAETTKVDFRDGRLTVRGPEGMTGWLFGRGSGSIRIFVRVPIGSSVSAKSASAPITFHGDMDVANAATASGAITVEKAASASVNTASGDLHVIECGGEVNGNTVSGDLQLDHVGGDVKAKSVSGDVRVDYVGGSVVGNSVSGDITINTVRAGLCKLNSVSGSISVGVAPGTGVWLDLNTVSGTTSSDLAVGDMPGDSKANLELRVTAVSGNIDVFRSHS